MVCDFTKTWNRNSASIDEWGWRISSQTAYRSLFFLDLLWWELTMILLDKQYEMIEIPLSDRITGIIIANWKSRALHVHTLKHSLNTRGSSSNNLHDDNDDDTISVMTHESTSVTTVAPGMTSMLPGTSVRSIWGCEFTCVIRATCDGGIKRLQVTRNTIFAVTREARIKGKHWE